MSKSKPKVFISYSWDNEEHKEFIKEFSNKLKLNDIDSIIDADIPLTPDEGWIQWMKNQVNNSNYVILVFTQLYYDRFSKNVKPNEGRGVQWESRLVLSDIYSGQSISKYIPVVLNHKDFDTCIPDELDCSRFNISTQFDELCNSIKDDWKVKNIVDKTRENHSFISEYLIQQNVSKEKLIEVCTKYLEKVYIDILIKYETIDNIINHIYTYKQFICIVKDLYCNYNEQMSTWLDTKDFTSCSKIENIEEIPRVVIIFTSKHIAQKFNVTFISKNLPNIPDSKSDGDYDLNDPKSKNELIDKVMSYVQIANPIVDLILPKELLGKDINLWEINFNESLSRFSRLNIRDINRYNTDDRMKDTIKKDWNSILDKVSNNQTLRFIKTEACLKNIGNNMNESGIASKYLLEEKHFNYLLKTQMSYIMLWFTKESEEELSDLYSTNIKDLQNKYYQLQNSPINLMWDDPTTYYYPDEREGKTNE